MFKAIHFKNFKVLRDTTLPLSRFTLIVGPNGSGKSTVLQALQILTGKVSSSVTEAAAVHLDIKNSRFEITFDWTCDGVELSSEVWWAPGHPMRGPTHKSVDSQEFHADMTRQLNQRLGTIRVFALDANRISATVPLRPSIELEYDGCWLPVVLDRLRDEHPERFDALNEELSRWLPEFDCVLFETPQEGHRNFALRTAGGQHRIPARHLSQGTLLALALLTLAYLPEPPPLIGIEEPDRGLHPRLLRDVRDALYRLAYPENYGETRPPVQVIATTHSPYFLDLFRDHPEEIVIAQKVGQEAKFERLADRPDIEEILQDAQLGDVWYSGILGGVPAQT